MGRDGRRQPLRGAGRSQGPAARTDRDHDPRGGGPAQAVSRRKRAPPGRAGEIGLEAALYEVWREAGISQHRLTRDLDIAKIEVPRMLDPNHSTKAAPIDHALRRLRKHVTVTAGEAD